MSVWFACLWRKGRSGTCVCLEVLVNLYNSFTLAKPIIFIDFISYTKQWLDVNLTEKLMDWHNLETYMRLILKEFEYKAFERNTELLFGKWTINGLIL